MQAQAYAVRLARAAYSRTSGSIEPIECVLAGIELDVDETDAVASREFYALFQAHFAAEVDADSIQQIHRALLLRRVHPAAASAAKSSRGKPLA
jgi:hypothetical protein